MHYIKQEKTEHTQQVPEYFWFLKRDKKEIDFSVSGYFFFRDFFAWIVSCKYNYLAIVFCLENQVENFKVDPWVDLNLHMLLVFVNMIGLN